MVILPCTWLPPLKGMLVPALRAMLRDLYSFGFHMRVRFLWSMCGIIQAIRAKGRGAKASE